MTPQDPLERLIRRLNQVLDRVENLLPAAATTPDLEKFEAFRWQSSNLLCGIARPHYQALADLLCMERQKAEVVRNTRQFVEGKPANNVLLWGARGTGKSSLVKAVFTEFVQQGLRLIEIDKEGLLHLPELVNLLYDRPERFVLFCDDLSFESDETGYKALKAVLEGTIAAPPDNMLLYATSNRRHLMPESMAENLEARPVNGEIHPGEAVEEKVSLSDRFGLWLSFYPLKQEEYLEIAAHWLFHLGLHQDFDADARAAALRWATQRGSRSGRVARQFALDWIGRQ